MKHFRIVALLICLVVDGCIEPLQIKIDNTDLKIVVDGMVTNEPGPQLVTIVYSRSNDEYLRESQPFTKASVAVIENSDVVYPMAEVEPGRYQAQTNWAGKIGSSYELRIIKNDNEYRSIPQTLVGPGSIDTLYVEFEEDAITYGDEGLEEIDAFKVLIDARGENPESDRLRWRFNGVYHARTYPELHSKMSVSGAIIPDPLPCSGYIVVDGIISKRTECECCECWPTEYGNTVLLSSPQIAVNGSYKKVDLMKIPITPLRFINKYRIEVEQLSLSPELYKYWKLVKAQQESGGNLFQPNAVKVRGNVFSTKNDEEVLGVFAVCGITRKNMYVDPSMIPYKLTPFLIREACKAELDNATDRPSYWP